MPNFMTDDGLVPDTSQVPGYLLAADNHNIGNTRGGSWFDVDTWGDKFSNAGKLLSTGVLSGANSFYNTGVTVGNWFGADAELNDTKAWITDIDSDLGQYYEKNRQAADLVGFIAGSFIPGMGGIKILNAGQTALRAGISTGLIGENLARATGLLIPQTERYVTLAAKDIASASATFSSINANGIKALASGFTQNVLEGVAFETAVQATMFKSPILEGQDGWDIAKNIAIGGVFQGVIGGAFSAAKSLGQIKSQASVIEKEIKPFSSRVLAEQGTSASDQIILMTEDKVLGPKPIPGSENYAIELKAYEDKIRRIDNDLRTSYRSLTKESDLELGNMLADASHGLDHNVTLQNMLGAQEVVRLNELTSQEKNIAKLAKSGKLEQIDPTESVSYVKLTGEGAGIVTSEAPIIKNIADTVSVSKGMNTEKAVMDEVRSYGFKPGQLWNPVELTVKDAHLEAEARHIWADSVLKEIKEGTGVHQYDIPVLERALKDGVTSIKIVDNKGKILLDGFSSKDELSKYILSAKDNAAADLLAKRVFKSAGHEETETAGIAKIVNVKQSALEGTLTNPDKDYFAWQSAKDEYKQFLQSKGLEIPANEAADPRFLPTYAKLARKAPELTDVDGHIIDGMTYIKQQQKMLKLAMDNVFAKNAPELADIVPNISDAQLLNANRHGAGATLVKYANGGYGSLESILQSVGSLTNKLKKSFRSDTETTLQSSLYKLLSNQEAAIEFQSLNNKITRSGELYVRASDTGTEYLVPRSLRDKFTKAGEIDFEGMLDEGGELIHQIHTPETVEFVDAHMSRTASRTESYSELRAAQGLTDSKDPAVFRPIRPNPKDYPFFAFVKDPSVTGQGHTTMVFANSEAKLSELIDKVPSKYQVLTKRDTEDFFKARGEYEYERTLNESYINSELKNSGVMSEHFTKTDPQKIVDDIWQQHLREDDTLAVELMRAKNQKAFDWLEDQGNAYTKVSASKFGSYSDRLEAAGKNPYLDYIKTALDISKASENPWLYGFNKMIDGAVSKAVGQIKDVFQAAKSPEQLAEINSLLDKYGMNTGYRDAATDLLVNHTAPKGELTKFVRTANAILSKLTLGLDPLNAVNNIIGANILRGTELKQITDAIKAGNSELAGQLSQLTKVALPGGVGEITAPTKLVSKAINNFLKDDGTLIERYKQAGFIKDASEQFKQILDDFTLKGTESVSELNTRVRRAFDKAKVLSDVGEKYSGNKLGEEFNRFISADVMRQLTDLGIEHGLMNKAEQQAYINTFVNRVEGNTIASQRPLMFQGPLGQAIGLFQSYQFNLMQQLFRYVAEGTTKDAAMLMGLQGTFYGLQGLPGFQFINQHIVGTLSGNQKHVDLYDSTYGVAGRQMGDLLMYGLPSNLLSANLYSRGDINPRQLTIIPTSLPDVPFINAFGKLLVSVKDTVSKIGDGAPVWESMLQGLEHNGLSRPLSGMAQTLQAFGEGGKAYSTSSKGTILFSNDLASWATAVRLAGGRPIDEAIINDGVHRIQAYQQYDRNKMNQLAETVKASSIQGNVPDQDQVSQFAKQYAAAGGKQAQFNKFMLNEFKSANTPVSQKIVSQLQNPFAQKIQVLMGGGSDSQPE